MISEPPRAAAAAVPAVGELCGDYVRAALYKFGHVVGLVLYALCVVGMSGSEHKVARAPAVYLHFIKPAGRDVQPRLYNTDGGKIFFETVDGVTPPFIDPVISAYPPGLPVGRI